MKGVTNEFQMRMKNVLGNRNPTASQTQTGNNHTISYNNGHPPLCRHPGQPPFPQGNKEFSKMLMVRSRPMVHLPDLWMQTHWSITEVWIGDKHYLLMPQLSSQRVFIKMPVVSHKVSHGWSEKCKRLQANLVVSLSLNQW